jgi:hypothetical protein
VGVVELFELLNRHVRLWRHPTKRRWRRYGILNYIVPLGNSPLPDIISVTAD